MVADLSDRDLRQRGILPPDRLAGCGVTVVGVGAIGRQVALQLAAVGVQGLQLVDFDVVGVENLAAQGFLEADLGEPKVDVTAELCSRINGGIDVTVDHGRFKKSMSMHPVVMVCVDSIETRKLIYDGLRWAGSDGVVELMVDGRMSAETIRILTDVHDGPHAHYPTTLFAAEEANTGECTAKTTIYCANIAAGFMVSQFSKWLRGMPLEEDMLINLLSAEVTVGEA